MCLPLCGVGVVGVGVVLRVCVCPRCGGGGAWWGVGVEVIDGDTLLGCGATTVVVGLCRPGSAAACGGGGVGVVGCVRTV